MNKISSLLVLVSAIYCTASHASAALTEADLNAPRGPQLRQIVRPYGDEPNDPPREDLRFPAFQPAWGLKREIYEKAVAFYEKNRANIANPRYATLIDFNQHSSKKRLYLFDLSNGKLERHNTAHGKNSDPENNGYASEFSNEEGSLKSSLGAYYTGATYSGNHGYSLLLDGLESTNDNAMSRAIVIHPADYVSNEESRAGRSWGCPALDPEISRGVIDRIKNGSLLLIGR